MNFLERAKQRVQFYKEHGNIERAKILEDYIQLREELPECE